MSIGFDPRTRFGFAGGYSGHGVVASNIAGPPSLTWYWVATPSW
jgi:hypothetical protein